ncbi:MAG: hypothetical protein QOG68_684 [Solirubrobacteraceae bacterium]|nr:hypothetical protein [Solirubrobacteraceae bacterium]
MSAALDRFVAAAPITHRAGLRMLLAIGRRPGGMRLIHRLGPLEQVANGLLAMDHFDAPAASIPLGWDPDAVAARGRELRHAEGRP